MLDMIMLALIAVFFVTAWAFARLCGQLLSTDAPGEDIDL
jgi:hypothetical protein